MGDVCASTAVFKYRQKLWGPNPEIHWYVLPKFKQPLEHNPHVIIHEAEKEEDYLAATKTLTGIAVREHYDKLYRPAPYLYGQFVLRVPILFIPPAIFGVKHNWGWRPEIYLTDAEVAEVVALMDAIPRCPRVLFEFNCNSNQSDWDDALTCELAEKLPRCVLVPPGPGEAEHMADLGIPNVVDIGKVNYRQLSEVFNLCDCYVGCASGGGVVSTARRCLRHPRAEYLRPEKNPGWSTQCVSGARTFSDRAEFVKYVTSLVKSLPTRPKRNRGGKGLTRGQRCARV